LRTCPHCSTINSDNTTSCGVCGASLSNTPSVTLEEAESIAIEDVENRESPVRTRVHLSKSGLFGIVFGIGLTVIGLMIFPLVSLLWSVLMIISGGVLILSAVNSLERTPSRPMFGAGGKGGRVGDSRWFMDKEAEREVAEMKKRKSGEAD
jgi:hypothetical protein